MIEANEYEGSVTVAEAALLAGVTKATIRSWVNRGLLTPERIWRGTNIFPIKDVWRAEAQARHRDTTGRAATRQ
jgi:DNA-binding transcriptional MerR regulator